MFSLTLTRRGIGEEEVAGISICDQASEKGPSGHKLHLIIKQ